jgi:hypothetical protein
MKPLVEEIAGLELARRRLEQWRMLNRENDRVEIAAPVDPIGRPPPLCERCLSERCGRAEYVVMSDAMTLRVGFRCAVEALLAREEFAGARGRLAIGVAQ